MAIIALAEEGKPLAQPMASWSLGGRDGAAPPTSSLTIRRGIHAKMPQVDYPTDR
jgi:hypothetical protein